MPLGLLLGSGVGVSYGAGRGVVPPILWEVGGEGVSTVYWEEGNPAMGLASALVGRAPGAVGFDAFSHVP